MKRQQCIVAMYTACTLCMPLRNAIMTAVIIYKQYCLLVSSSDACSSAVVCHQALRRYLCKLIYACILSVYGICRWHWMCPWPATWPPAERAALFGYDRSAVAAAAAALAAANGSSNSSSMHAPSSDRNGINGTLSTSLGLSSQQQLRSLSPKVREYLIYMSSDARASSTVCYLVLQLLSIDQCYM
jgi:hypothetical protein